MFEPDATLEQVMNAVVLKWGTAAPLYNLAGVAGWNAQWLPAAEQEPVLKAAASVAKAAEVIERIEEASLATNG